MDGSGACRRCHCQCRYFSFQDNDFVVNVPNIRYASVVGNQSKPRPGASGGLLPLITSDPVGAICTPFLDCAEFLGGD